MATADPAPAPPVVGEPAGAASPIEGVAALADRGERGARAAALRLVAAGLAACDVAAATAAAIALDGDLLTVAGQGYELDPGGRVLVVGAGKASLGIASELERVLGDRLEGGAIAIRGDQPAPLSRIEVLGADHPLPSGRSIDAARRLLAIAEDAGDRDIVIACFTGGSSALASLPPEGVSAAEKRELHELLLSSGISIVDINTVRKHVSSFKGGRLAAAAAPARLINLSVSDVAGDQIDAITDPSVADGSRAADAVAILDGQRLWDRVPASIREHLRSGAAESPDLSGTEIQTVLLVTGATACEAMAAEARALSLAPVVVSTTLEGEARQVGRLLANLARESCERGSPFSNGAAMLGCGGESTVTLEGTGGFGEGGPNQEAALAAALELDGCPVAAVFVDTDGSDGGTAHAGAIVDGRTVGRAASAGLDLRAALLEHRSRAAVTALDDALVTGPTGTNVNDLFAIVIEGNR